MLSVMRPIILATLLAMLLCTAAQARPARCSTSDDGSYPCDFQATDKDGSFAISAKGKPTFMLNMKGPGLADGYADYGSRNVSLPGEYRRSTKDPACWLSTETRTQICAR